MPREAIAIAIRASSRPDRVTDRADHIDDEFRRRPVRRDQVAPGAHSIDIELIAEGIAARNTDSLGRLYDLMGRRAFGLAYTVTGDATLAEDAVQDAFLSLWRQAETVSAARGKIESLLLLMTMVHRRAVDHVRSRARSDRANDAMKFGIYPSLEGDPQQMVVDNTEQAAIHGVLKRLPDEQKQAIELAYFRGLTQREIADATGVSLGTVKGRMRLGLEKLRTAFGLGEERS
ncbi:MAG: sigma-70 family RNA polymerase sigma factor [Chloroflexi bacterium]|nr:sigma-70 family RNA polymerase sigma factor [Chloroflexota bacterium]